MTTAIGVAAGAGAAQLGVGYGLGIIAWVPGTEPDSQQVWVNSLAWVAWLAATSTVVGALVADRLSRVGPDHDDLSATAHLVTVAWRVVIALSAAVGALITVPLVAVPARTPRPDNVVPYFTAGGYAVVGVIVGLLVAIGALSARAAAANIIASTAWLWTLAVVAVIDGVRAGGDLGTAQLATWQFTDARWVRNLVNLPGALMMLTIALIIGLLAAWPAGRRGDNRIGVAISGAAGPLLVAAAYFLAAPGLGENDQQLSAFVMAPYAVLAGLAGSVVISAIGPKGARTAQRAERRAAMAERERAIGAERERRTAATTTEWTQALAAAESADRPATDAKSTRGAADERPTADLPADGYAPARAYDTDPATRAYAEDSGDPKPDATGAPAATETSTATGRAAVKEPLWPDTTKPSPTPTANKRGKRSGPTTT